jgi:hypothetical protein
MRRARQHIGAACAERAALGRASRGRCSARMPATGSVAHPPPYCCPYPCPYCTLSLKQLRVAHL